MNIAQPSRSPGREGPTRLSEIYDEAFPEVYRYLRSRCGSTEVAEELTSATFVQAALECSKGEREISVGWLITVARHKLIDHWRHLAVVDRSMILLEGARIENVDPWDQVLDHSRTQHVLAELDPHYRMVLTLRYLDDLSVPECARHLGRTVRGTESMLARARKAFRANYERTGEQHD